MEAEGDEEHVLYRRRCALSSYLMYLINTAIFVDKSVTYVDLIHLTYFIDLEMIHKYN